MKENCKKWAEFQNLIQVIKRVIFCLLSIFGFATLGSAALAQSADLQVVVAGPTSGIQGGAFTYTITLENAGPNSADGATFIDKLFFPATNVTASCSSATLGATCPSPTITGSNPISVGGTITTFPVGAVVKITVQGNFPLGGASSVTNTATISTPSGVTETNSLTNTSTINTQIDNTADLQATIVGSPATYVGSGDYTFTIVYKNNSLISIPSAAINEEFFNSSTGTTSFGPISCVASGGVVCPSPASLARRSSGYSSATITNWPAGATLTITYTMTYTAGCGSSSVARYFYSHASIRIDSLASPNLVDSNQTNNDQFLTYNFYPTNCPPVEMSVSKTGTPSTYNGDGTYQYTVVYTNNSGFTVPLVSIKDIFSVPTNSDYNSPPTYLFTASLSSVSCVASGGVICPTGLAMEQQIAYDEDYNQPYLSGTYLYNKQVSNWPDNATLTITYTATITAINLSDPVWSTCGATILIDNIAAVTVLTPGYTELNALNNTQIKKYEIVNPPCKIIDLRTSVSIPQYLGAGDYLDTITYTNVGATNVDTVKIEHTYDHYFTDAVSFSSISCVASGGVVCPTGLAMTLIGNYPTYSQYTLGGTVTNWPAGATLTIKYTRTLAYTVVSQECPKVSGGSFLSGISSLRVGDVESYPYDNYVRYFIGPSCTDIAVSKSVSATSVEPGQALSFTVSVINSGPTAVTSNTPLSFDDPLPSEFIYSSVNCVAISGASCGSTTYDLTTRTVKGRNLILPVGAKLTYTISGTAGEASTQTNIAFVTMPPNLKDTVISSNSSQVNFSITGLIFQKIAPYSVKPSDQIKYTLFVRNTGIASLLNIVVSDPIPAGTSFISATNGGVFNTSTNTVSWLVPTLNPSEIQTFEVTVAAPNVTTVKNASGVKVVNLATVTSSNASSKTASATTLINYDELSKKVRNITKNESFGLIGSGLPSEVLEYCLDFKNYGSTPMSNYVLNDTLSSNLKAVLNGYDTERGSGSGYGIKLTLNGGSATYFTSTTDLDAAELIDLGGNTQNKFKLKLATLQQGDAGQACFKASIR